jgi:hypothetical protein
MEAPQTPPAPTPTPTELQIQSGHLTPFQAGKLKDWVVLKWGKGVQNGLPVCEMCKEPGTSWVASSHTLAPVVVANGGMNFGGVVYPHVSLMCSNCGNTHFVNAVLSGVMKINPDGTLGAATPDEVKNG